LVDIRWNSRQDDERRPLRQPGQGACGSPTAQVLHWRPSRRQVLDPQLVRHRLPVAVVFSGQPLQIDGRRLQPRVIEESLSLVDVAACSVVELGTQVPEAVDRDRVGVDTSLGRVALQGLSDRLAGQRLVAFRFRSAVVIAQVLAGVRGGREERFVAGQLPAGNVQIVPDRLPDWRGRQGAAASRT
jgi:hypothetical protein